MHIHSLNIQANYFSSIFILFFLMPCRSHCSNYRWSSERPHCTYLMCERFNKTELKSFMLMLGYIFLKLFRGEPAANWICHLLCVYILRSHWLHCLYCVQSRIYSGYYIIVPHRLQYTETLPIIGAVACNCFNVHKYVCEHECVSYARVSDVLILNVVSNHSHILAFSHSCWALSFL